MERTPDPGLTMGVEAMDRDHEHIFALVHELGRAVDRAGPPAVVTGVLNVLLFATRRHMQAEEQLMAESGYPKTQEHRAAHAVLLEDLKTFSRLNGPLDASAIQSIDKCLRHHTATLDRDLGEHINAEAAISA